MDIAPELLSKIQEYFDFQYNSSEEIRSLLKKVAENSANYDDAIRYAQLISEFLTNGISKFVSAEVLPEGRMYYNIAEKVLRPLLESGRLKVVDISVSIQETLNKIAKIGLKARRPVLNDDRIKGIIDKISDAPNYDDVKWLVSAPLENLMQNAADETLKANMEFQKNCGLNPIVIRTLQGGCCDWCRKLAGTYSYPNVPGEVFMRHDNCRCTVVYDGTKLKSHTNRSGVANTFRR